LLVVTGIIAVLAAIVLPVLGGARRRAAQVQCLASLNQIGNGFKLYACEFEGYWPVAVHQQGLPPLLLPQERRWYDLLAPYVSGTRGIQTAADIATIRRNSVIWGCPAWAKSSEYNPNSTPDKLLVGYAMQYQPMIDSTPDTSKFAFIGSPPVMGFKGSYIKDTVWGRRGGERGVIGCSSNHVVVAAESFSRSTSEWLPFPQTDLSKPRLLFDSTRHLRSGTSKAASARQKGLNMLFADGHAQPVTIVEAWTAIRWPGLDKAEP
jgi:prepilin-type processing-associated H-X9-DG protein